jgi:hypothetical protein
MMHHCDKLLTISAIPIQGSYIAYNPFLYVAFVFLALTLKKLTHTLQSSWLHDELFRYFQNTLSACYFRRVGKNNSFER